LARPRAAHPASGRCRVPHAPIADGNAGSGSNGAYGCAAASSKIRWDSDLRAAASGGARTERPLAPLLQTVRAVRYLSGPPWKECLRRMSVSQAGQLSRLRVLRGQQSLTKALGDSGFQLGQVSSPQPAPSPGPASIGQPAEPRAQGLAGPDRASISSEARRLAASLPTHRVPARASIAAVAQSHSAQRALRTYALAQQTGVSAPAPMGRGVGVRTKSAGDSWVA